MTELTEIERCYVRLARAIYLLALDHGYTRGRVIDWLDNDAYEWPPGLQAAWENARALDTDAA